jgi:hypothetical protein
MVLHSFNKPSGPVNANPRALASATIAAAAACSGDSCRPDLSPRPWTHKIRCHHYPCPSHRISARRVGPDTPILKQSLGLTSKPTTRYLLVGCVELLLDMGSVCGAVLGLVQRKGLLPDVAGLVMLAERVVGLAEVVEGVGLAVVVAECVA